LCGGEPVDDAAKQQRLGELREGHSDIRRNQRKRQPPLGAELGEHPGVKFEKAHGTGRARPWRYGPC
jgi:hypothetical protein